MKLLIATLLTVALLAAPAASLSVESVLDRVDQIIGREQPTEQPRPEPQPQQPAQPTTQQQPAPQPAPQPREPARTVRPQTPSVMFAPLSDVGEELITEDPAPNPTVDLSGVNERLDEIEDEISAENAEDEETSKPYLVVLAAVLLVVVATLTFFLAGKSAGSRQQKVDIIRKLTEVVGEEEATRIVEYELRNE